MGGQTPVRSGPGPGREALPQHRDVRRAEPEGGEHPVAPLVQPLDRVREVASVRPGSSRRAKPIICFML